MAAHARLGPSLLENMSRGNEKKRGEWENGESTPGSAEVVSQGEPWIRPASRPVPPNLRAKTILVPISYLTPKDQKPCYHTPDPPETPRPRPENRGQPKREVLEARPPRAMQAAP